MCVYLRQPALQRQHLPFRSDSSYLGLLQNPPTKAQSHKPAHGFRCQSQVASSLVPHASAQLGYESGVPIDSLFRFSFWYNSMWDSGKPLLVPSLCTRGYIREYRSRDAQGKVCGKGHRGPLPSLAQRPTPTPQLTRSPPSPLVREHTEASSRRWRG